MDTSNNLNEQLKNISPEAMANLQKAQIQGQMHLLKNGPWYYKLYALIFAILFIVFIVFFTSGVMESIERQKEFDQNWNTNSPFAK